MTKKEKRINPIRITNSESNEVYVLEFSRQSVKFAENRGFKISELLDFPQTNIPAFWYYAFRKNHGEMSRAQTDALLDEMGGLTSEVLERLVQLYNAPSESLIASSDEAERKNSRFLVEM